MWEKVCTFWFLYHCVTLEMTVATDDQTMTRIWPKPAFVVGCKRMCNGTFKPCQGRLPRRKYINIWPNASKSSLLLCSGKKKEKKTTHLGHTVHSFLKQLRRSARRCYKTQHSYQKRLGGKKSKWKDVFSLRLMWKKYKRRKFNWIYQRVKLLTDLSKRSDVMTGLAYLSPGVC